ncbi:MAG: PhoH family protein [Deltaproteobacteria bacterium]|nr:PhoH family protein [Deltaproteobacteria bacterium]
MTNSLDLADPAVARQLFGEQGTNIKLVESLSGAQVAYRGSRLLVTGDSDVVDVTVRLLRQLYGLVEKGFAIRTEDIHKALDMVRHDKCAPVKETFLDAIPIPTASRAIAPKSTAQRAYVEMIREKNMVFAIGPAGTGKTYLAVAMAVSALLARKYKRLVLARPAVEAGEKLGFLPGDIAEKVNPYLRPLYDALEDMMDVDRVRKSIERGVIEIAPLAFMRGRTLNDSFVILDEAQNTTPEQMKMFLTRLGFESQAVITGDITQVDLPPDKESGLVHATRILEGIPELGFCRFTSRDVVRHPLVARIVEAYQVDEERRKGALGPPQPPNP